MITFHQVLNSWQHQQILASGSFPTVIALAVGISQPSLSQIFTQVLNALLRRSGQYIHFPTTTADFTNIKQDLFQIANFPNVIGAIDCTHIQTLPPSIHEHIYRNRKHTYSMNVQVIWDANMTPTNVVAKYPRSVDDSFIFRNSAIYPRLSYGAFGEDWLLGKFICFSGDIL